MNRPVQRRFLSRRAAGAALAAALSAAILPAAQAQSTAQPPSDADLKAYATCLGQLRPDALKAGVSGATFDTYTQGITPDMSILELLDAQPEFKTPIWDYLASLVDAERIHDGEQGLEQWSKELARIQTQYGVDPATVVAVWGVESNFGKNLGGRPLLQSLSTLSCFGRRQAYFRGEFFATLKIIQDEHVKPERLNGSWAGAFGQTQFMPSTYLRLAVDFDGDGRRDLVDSVPDALASTANFLKRAGWNNDIPWGFEVTLPSGLDTSGAGRRNKKPMSQWAAAGIKRANGRALPAGELQAGLLLPAGPQGPAFLVTKNFDALYSYNAAESYGLAIAHLSDRLRGGMPFVRAWPTDDPGLSRAERREIQELLVARGYDIGKPDGVIGTRTRQALQQVQRELGLPDDGRAGQKTLKALRQQ
ncbi:lytic transglycosylase [Bordetella genomosp. 1]|uniref:Lytic transglycosylase n=1 Tax=Bordetella genomosp. 1 TaxID=1395607 RepID=A0A261SR99_9BORD|nr:lytic murein transglycosylase [Bordetella genomosp. 1]MDQ8032750.1 lytic murein transglycosylase [Bordetella sp.]OZI39380.1 lytic transglycosylase [Bordetella genomosp. 1]